MSSRSLNKVLLIGNLTDDPELRYTPQGTAVATFTIATNRNWIDQSGQPQESAEFTRCVAWAKLAEVCSQILHKGKKAFIEGRLQTREWEGQDKIKRRVTEAVVETMIALSPPGPGVIPAVSQRPKPEKKDKKNPVSKDKSEETLAAVEEEIVSADDIPF